MAFITDHIRNRVFKNLLSGEYFVLSTLFAQLLIYSIAIVSIYVSNHEKLHETSLFWKASSLRMSDERYVAFHFGSA